MTGNEALGLVMLVVMIGVIFVGFPISFTLLFLALVFGYVGLGTIVFDLAFFQTIGMMKEQTLAAVPLFIFMGYVVEQAGLMERLFRGFQLALAPVRGSLYLGVILTATIFAMATGIVGAAVTVLGIMAAPIMMKSGYSPRLLGRRDRRRRHARHPHPAERHAGRHGPGHQRVGGQAVRRGVRPRLPPGRPLHRVHADPELPESRAGPAAAQGASAPPRSGRWCASSSSGWSRWRSSSRPRWAPSWPAW